MSDGQSADAPIVPIEAPAPKLLKPVRKSPFPDLAKLVLADEASSAGDAQYAPAEKSEAEILVKPLKPEAPASPTKMPSASQAEFLPAETRRPGRPRRNAAVPESEMTQFTLRLPRELRDRLVISARQSRTSAAGIVIKMIEEKLSVAEVGGS